MATYTNSDQTGRKGWRWALVGLTVVILLITGAVLLSGGGEQPNEQQAQKPDAKKVAGSFIAAIVVTDGKASFDLMSERLQKQLISEARWDRYIDVEFGKSREAIALSRSTEIKDAGNPKPLQLVYEYDADLTDDAVQEIELVVRRIDGSWKVDEFFARDR